MAAESSCRTENKENLKCCIHCTDADDKLTPLKSEITWNTLKNAAIVRKHSVESSEIDPSTNLPKLMYHRKCYQYFTLKRNLDRIDKQNKKDENSLSLKLSKVGEFSSDEEKDCKPTREKTPSRILLKKECIFCRKAKRNKNQARQSLTSCIDDRAIDSIRYSAEKKNDFNMLGLLSKNIISAEAYYHENCYKVYTKVKYIEEKPEKDERYKHEVELPAYTEILKYCHELQQTQEVVPFINLLQKMEMIMKTKNEVIQNSTKKNLRRNLERDVVDIKFVKVDGSLYVYPISLGTEQIIIDFIKIRKKLETSRKEKEEFNNLEQSSKAIISCGKYIRKEIQGMKDTIPWPPHPDELTPDKIQIPPGLDLLLSSILSDNPTNVSTRAARKKLSFVQDIVYAVTDGIVKTPKSILLPTMVKTLTNNTELITILNRLGHGISYSTLMELQTENAYKIVEQQLQTDMILPKDCMREAFTIYVADNIDRKEETLSGYGTTHKVNNLLIQNGNFADVELIRNSPKRKKSRRSFEPVSQSNHVAFPPSGKRVGPAPMEFPENMEKEFLLDEREKSNVLWALLRWGFSVREIVPSWTGFNITVHEGIAVLKSSVKYMDCIDAPATEISTIYQVLCRALQIIESLRLVSLVCVFDQAIYSKACEVKWKEPQKFKSCILMMGMFHLLMVYMNILSKRFADAGLRDALLQSAVVAEGSVDMALKGKHYNRGVRLYKLFYEVLLRLMISHLSENDGLEFLRHKVETTESFTKEMCEDVKQSNEFETLYHRFLDLKLQWDNDDANSLRKFWLSCLDMIGLLLNTIHACRSGSWTLLLECLREILPYAFAYDHINYSRYLTVMLGDMLSLEESFPEVYAQFMMGNFVVQLSEETAFSRTEADKVIEMTINKDTKTPGGTTGFSTNTGAVQRWEVNASYRAALRTVFHQYTNYHQQSYKHKDFSPSRIKKDESGVAAIINVLHNSFVDPFSEQQLLSISTGITVTEKVQKEILGAYETGKKAMKKFINDRLISGSEISIFDPIRKIKTPTFKTANKITVIKAKGKTIQLQNSKDLFCKIALIGQKRSINMKELFRYPLGSLPLSIAEGDGTLKKTAKSVLMHKLEENVDPVERVTGDYAFIADGMAYVRQLRFSKMIYKDFPTKLLNALSAAAKSAKRIDVVFDFYAENSIKDVERARRSCGEISLKQIVPTSEIKQWNQLLSSGQFKNKLVDFIVQEWKKQKHLIGDILLYTTVGENAYKITRETSEDVIELQSDHDEADTRLILHAKHASLTYEKVVISTPDTDVFIIALSQMREINSNLYLLTGTKDKRRIIDIKAVGEEANDKLNKTDCTQDEFLDALLGFHSFTGCDTISSFAARGKLKPLSLLGTSKDYITAFSSLGAVETVSEELMQALENFVCHMYGKRRVNQEESLVNDLRYNIYCQKSGKISCDRLPPCLNVLQQHVLRANYQAKIWRKSLQPYINIEAPIDNGWYLNEGELDIQWMTCSPAPDEILELVSCKCTRKCENRCVCFQNGFSCTDACLCKECENDVSSVETDDSDRSDYDSEDETDSNSDSDY